jgi:hypothetical protein
MISYPLIPMKTVHTALGALAYLLCAWLLIACTSKSIEPLQLLPRPGNTSVGAAQTPSEDAPLLAADNEWGAYDHDIAHDMQGSALAVWEQYDGVRYSIWANRKLAGHGWGVAQMIETEKYGNAYNPRIAVDSQGNAVAVWQQVGSASSHIAANRYMVGTGWSASTWIEAAEADSAQAPQVRFDSQDNAVAVWQQRQGIRTSIHANRLKVGAGWGKAAQIAPAQRNAHSPEINIDAQGFVVAQWQNPEGTQNYKGQSRLMAGGSWGLVDLVSETAATWH